MAWRDNEEYRREYYARRNQEPARRAQKAAGAKIYHKNLGRTAQFFAIDSEGGDDGRRERIGDLEYRAHQSFLWGASNADGEDHWLYTGNALGTEEICSFLRELKEKHKQAIFISFAFNYDVAQLVRDLPYEKAWELQHGTPHDELDDPETKQSNRVVLWKNWGFQYRKGKLFTLYWFGPNRDYYVRDKRGNKKLNASGRIRIYDVFGFFQSSFLRAIKSMPGVCSEDEYKIIEAGKAERGSFYVSDIDNIMRYTKHELIVLCRMMNKLRASLYDNDMKITTWFGAGSIAQALLKREETRQYLAKTVAKKPPLEQKIAHHAYFGGRIELLKQGATSQRLWSYDIASAYPAAASVLSSMCGGLFKHVVTPSWGEVMACDALSMVKIYAKFPDGLPFYPLPYRMPNGAILFPRETFGWYMRDDAVAALDFCQHFDCEIDLLEMYRFILSDAAEPFRFLKHLFDYRASLSKDDITQIVIKLGINSVYGKLAQSVGQWGKAPAFASPWHAAAITAWTRRKLMDAALCRPQSIVMFATDGIISEDRLNVFVPATKLLGHWEESELPEGGVFVQSGVYTISGEKGWITKSRGFRPTNVAGDISEYIRKKIPELWKLDAQSLTFPYMNLMTLGASVRTREAWEHCGHWNYGARDLDLRGCGVKRDVSPFANIRRGRAHRLVETTPSCRNSLLADDEGHMVISAPSRPDWLDADWNFENALENEQEQVFAGMT